MYISSSLLFLFLFLFLFFFFFFFLPIKNRQQEEDKEEEMSMCNISYLLCLFFLQSYALAIGMRAQAGPFPSSSFNSCVNRVSRYVSYIYICISTKLTTFPLMTTAPMSNLWFIHSVTCASILPGILDSNRFRGCISQLSYSSHNISWRTHSVKEFTRSLAAYWMPQLTPRVHTCAHYGRTCFPIHPTANSNSLSY